MKPPDFHLEQPRTLADAVAVLARAPEESKVLAGGQSLVPLLNFRLVEPRVLIDLNPLGELDYVRMADARLRVGALTRTITIERSADVMAAIPVLAHGASWIGHLQIRNRGTVGGSLAHADPSAELPALAVLLDGSVTLTSAGGQRRVAADGFFAGFLTTVAEPDEIVTEIDFAIPAPGATWGFCEFAQRRGDFALAGAACLIDDGAARIVAFGASDRPLRCHAAEGIVSRSTDGDAVATAARLAADEVRQHVTSAGADAAYRLALIEPMVRRALDQATAAGADRREPIHV